MQEEVRPLLPQSRLRLTTRSPSPPSSLRKNGQLRISIDKIKIEYSNVAPSLLTLSLNLFIPTHSYGFEIMLNKNEREREIYSHHYSVITC